MSSKNIKSEKLLLYGDADLNPLENKEALNANLKYINNTQRLRSV